ncbi:MAG TPA: hypothetical protein VFS12_01285 [Terriglobia bacterium]|nr:hypothetical protein [Terriglobia bacterium]
MTTKCLTAAFGLACFLPLTLAAQEGPLPIPGRVATLAFFLDSTDTLEPGTLWFTTVATYRKAPGGKELDIPALSVSFGLARRVQVDFSIPYFRTEYGSDFRMTGIGDKFLSAKIRLRDADSGKLGLAFEPVLEILGKGSLAAGELGPKKYNVALPIIVQKNFSRFNLYSEAGYITRGAVFAGVGSDAPIYRRLGGGMNVLYSRATRFNDLSREFGLLRSRVDGNLGLYYMFHPRFSVFASAGKTLSRMDAIATSYILNLGLNFNFNVRDLHRRREQ